MVLDETETCRLKQIELEILRSFITVCNKLNIKYYVIGGTLLGAVRHKGFIPWDDDIDVALFRDDYALFQKEAQRILPTYYFVQTHETDENYPLNFMKLRDSRTTFVETTLRKFDINHGVYIDIFPLDDYPLEEKEQARIEKSKRILNYRMRIEYDLPSEVRHDGVVEFGLNVLGNLARLKFPTIESVVNARELLFCSKYESNIVINHSGAWGIKEVWNKEWFEGDTFLEFEGLQVRVPTRYEELLSKVYGNFMELPPEEKRVAHHYNEIVDLENSYLDHLR